MTVGYVVAFGGVLAIVLLGLLAEAILKWYERRKPAQKSAEASVDQLLADATTATKRVAADIEKVRTLLTEARS
jgi:hypothetical protein